MSRNKHFQKLILKSILCLSVLPVLFALFTSKASLQNTTAANTVRTPNVNSAPNRARRRNSSNRAVNTRINSPDPMPDADYLPDPTPTPTPPANSTVRARVYYAETGRPVKRSMVMLMNADGIDGPVNSMSGLTDGEGKLQIKNVRAGTYYAMVNAPGVVSPMAYADFNKKGDKEIFKNAFEDFAPIIVDGINDTDVQIPAQRGGAIGGRIMYDDGDAAIGVKVEILRKVDDKYMSVIPNFSAILSMTSGSGSYQTDDRGVYRFAGLPPGDYIVKVTESTSHGDSPQNSYYNPFDSIIGASSFLTIFYPDAFDTKSAQLINVQFGQEISEVNLIIPSRNLYKLEGRLVNLKDKSPVRAKISIKQDVNDDVVSIFNELSRRRSGSVLTDENGNWKFKELPKGAYKLVVEPVEGESVDGEYYDGSYVGNSNMANMRRNAPAKPRLAKKTQEIIIEDKDLTEMVIEIGYGGTISGTVSVENNQKMPTRLTIMTFVETEENFVSANVENYMNMNPQTLSKQNYEFKLENVMEGKNYFLIQSADRDYYVKSVTANGVDLLTKPFEVKEGEVWRNVQIVLGTDVGTLKGVVLDDKKEPVGELEIWIVPTDPAKRRISGSNNTAKTDPSGEFEIKAAPGEYAVIFYSDNLAGKSREEALKWLDEAITGAQTVKIEAGKTGTVTLQRKK